MKYRLSKWPPFVVIAFNFRFSYAHVDQVSLFLLPYRCNPLTPNSPKDAGASVDANPIDNSRVVDM